MGQGNVCGEGRKVGVATLRWMWGEEERESDNSQLEKPTKAWINPCEGQRRPGAHVEVGKAVEKVQSQLEGPLEPTKNMGKGSLEFIIGNNSSPR